MKDIYHMQRIDYNTGGGVFEDAKIFKNIELLKKLQTFSLTIWCLSTGFRVLSHLKYELFWFQMIASLLWMRNKTFWIGLEKLTISVTQYGYFEEKLIFCYFWVTDSFILNDSKVDFSIVFCNIFSQIQSGPQIFLEANQDP